MPNIEMSALSISNAKKLDALFFLASGKLRRRNDHLDRLKHRYSDEGVKGSFTNGYCCLVNSKTH